MSRSKVSGHFIQGTKGAIFVLLRQPRTQAAGCVLVVPPFAEEMNKCRRMVAEVSFALADRGLATIVPDLYGTGDSAGDFNDGDWQTWKADLGNISSWAAALGLPVTGLLAIRLGCALAMASSDDAVIPPVKHTVLWQPVYDGSRFLAQFIRLRIAASLMEDQKETLADLKARLQAGNAVEVAGYELSPRMAADLETVELPRCLSPSLGAVAWLEVVRAPEASLPPPSQKLIEGTRSAGGSVHAAGFPGEPFWSATEIVVNRGIVSATVAHFGESAQAEGITRA